MNAADIGIEELHTELARERAMRKSTGCECPTNLVPGGVHPGHAAGCSAMEVSRMHEERDYYRDVAHAIMALVRADARTAPGRAGLLDACARAYNEPKKEPTDG